MKLPYSWLCTLLPGLPEPTALEPLLSGLGLELESLTKLPSPPEGVVFGRSARLTKIPDTELWVLHTDIGGRSESLVSTAPNVHEGMGLAVALPGTVLPSGVQVSARAIQGQTSFGMALSPAEMGFGIYAAGLLDLPPDALAPGTPLAEAWTEEWVLELSLTPNRADALSVLGVARDLAASLKLPLNLHTPAPHTEALPFPVEVRVEDRDGCDRYVARYATDLRIGPSPLYAQRHLLAAGMRPINNIVDATNYVMLELGNPLHAFDRRDVNDGIVVRRARSGETLVTLDGVKRTLKPDDLLITAMKNQKTQPIGVAGVIGGENSEVRRDTTEVIVEAAHFDPVTVRLTAKRLGLSTDASYRFERGVDPVLPATAADRFLELIQDWALARVAAEGRSLGHPAPRPTIRFDPGVTGRLLGTRVDEDEQLSVLRNLGCTVEFEGGGWLVQPPSWRMDLHIAEDLIEEVARMVGYDAIPVHFQAFLPAEDSQSVGTSFQSKTRLRTLLAGLGFQEVINYPWTSGDWLRTARAPLPLLYLQNPLDSGADVLRTALYPGLLGNLRTNSETPSILLFELGQVFGEPHQEHLAAVLSGPVIGAGWQAGIAEGFFTLKGLLETLAEHFGAALEVQPKMFKSLHPGVSGEVFWEGRPAGFIGQLHPQANAALELPTVHLLELSLPLTGGISSYRELPRFPAARRDLAVVVPKETSYAEVADLLRANAGAVLWSLELFDVYGGPSLPPEQKSLAFHLEFRSSEHTLTDEEVNTFIADSVHAVLQAGYTIRDSSHG